MPRTKPHQQQADILAADVERFLAEGGTIRHCEDHESNDRYLKQIDKGLKIGKEQTEADGYQFNRSM